MVAQTRRTAASWQVLGAWRIHGGEPSVVLIDGGRRVPPLLCVLALQQPDDVDLADHVIAAIADTYGDPTPAALTTRIVASARAAHEVLRDDAVGTASNERRRAALICLARRGAQVYLAHAGPVAFQLVPTTSGDAPAAPPLPTPLTAPLGRQGEAPISLAALPLTPQTLLAVAAGPLAARWDEDAWAWLLQTHEPDEIRARLDDLRQKLDVPDMTVALVAPGMARQERSARRSRFGERRPRPARAAAHAHGAPEVANTPAAQPSAVPPEHSRSVLAGVLFALFLALVAGGMLVQRAPSSLFVGIASAPPPAAVLAGASASSEHTKRMHPLSSRGAVWTSDDSVPLPAPVEAPAQQPLETIALGTLRTVVHRPEGAIRDLALLGRTLLVVDDAQGQVVKYFLDPYGPGPQPEVLWAAGERRSSVTLGQPARVASRQVGRPTANELIVLTADGTPWLLGNNTVSRLPALPVGAEVVRIAATPDVLYALTASPAAVWALALTQPASGWRHLLDAEGALDLAADEAVYLVWSQGQITRHAPPATLPFPAIIPGEPLRSPRAIAARPQLRRVLVLEPDHQRIIAFAKDGTPLQQFRFAPSASTGDLHVMAADDRRGWLVMADDTRVYFAPLPR